jgi:hypothetical protein
MKTFDYIQDPAHGWIKVPAQLLVNLSIHRQISPFSYYRNAFVYLEEDGDAAAFFNAYRAKYGHDPKLRDRVAREKRSKIRSYTCYTPHIVENLITQEKLKTALFSKISAAKALHDAGRLEILVIGA